MSESQEPLLLTPGPTRVPPEVMVEMNKPMIHHRSQEFSEIFASTRNNLNLMTQTDGDSVILTASGTAAMEAVIASFFSPSDHVVIVDGGKFGQRWVNLAHRYRLSFTVIQKAWGKAVTPADILPNIFPHTRAVLMQACESSTGVYNPVEKIGEALFSYPEVMFFVDAITALGIHSLSMRSHRIDVLIGASQKALMCPPGLATVSMSARAIDQIRSSQSLYLSLENELVSQKKNQPAFTPAISLVRGLEQATDMILNEGLRKVYQRHERMQKLTRGFFRSLGFQCFTSDEDASPGITAVRGIQGMHVEHWLKTLRSQNKIWLASGQGELKGAIFRVAHMGYCDEQTLIPAFKTIAQSVKKILPIDKAMAFLNNP